MSFHFVLKRKGWGYDDLYEALKTGEKTSEWRDASDHWKSRLLTKPGIIHLEYLEYLQRSGKSQHHTIEFQSYYWKHKRARFVVGYTKSPLLIADVKAIMYHSKTEQFEVQIENVVEVRK